MAAPARWIHERALVSVGASVGDGVGAGGERQYREDQRCAALSACINAGTEFRAGDHPIRQRRSAEIALLRFGNMRANGV
jgi:hypothetical protein